MKKFPLPSSRALALAALVAAPFAVLLPDCGGSSRQVTVTPTPFPTTTPTPAPMSAATFDLTSSPDVSGGSLLGNSFFLANDNLIARISYSNTVFTKRLTLPRISASDGAVRTLSANDTDANYVVVNRNSGKTTNTYIAKFGTVTVTAFSSTAATLTFKDVIYTDSSTGENITVNGTVSGPYTR